MTTLYDDLSNRPEWSCPACKSRDARIDGLLEENERMKEALKDVYAVVRTLTAALIESGHTAALKGDLKVKSDVED